MIKITVNNDKLIDELTLVVKLFYTEDEINGKDIEFTITSKDDGLHSDGMVQINGGTFTISAAEGIEATYVKIDD